MEMHIREHRSLLANPERRLLIWLARQLPSWVQSDHGTLARVRCQPRPRYGYYVDHVIDLFGTAAVVAGMGASGLITPAIALLLLVAYFLVSAETFLATHTVGVFR